ncbi:MAG: VanZ family protein [Gammaproteobacteria bacterium]
MAHNRTAGLFYLMLAILYMAGIYRLSAIPGDAGAAGLGGIIAWTPPAIQNLLHIPLFGILAWLWYRTLAGWITRLPAVYVLVFIVTAGFGVLDEWHQLTIPGRYASLTDIALNTLGTVVALWLIARSGRLAHQPVTQSTE